MTSPAVTESTESAAENSGGRLDALRHWLVDTHVRTVALRATLAIGSLFAIVLLAAVAERIIYSGQVLPGVQIEGVDVEGLSTDDALDRTAKLAQRLESEAIAARADSTDLSVNPSALRLDVDHEASVRNARLAGRSGNPFEAVGGFILRRFRTEEVALAISFDVGAVNGVIDGWQGRIADGAREGDLQFDGTDVVVVEPRPGRGFDRDAAHADLVSVLGGTTRPRIDLDVRPVAPEVDRREVEALAERARGILRKQYVVRGPRGSAIPPPPDVAPQTPAEITIRAEQVAATLDALVVKGKLRLRLDHELLDEQLASAEDVFATPPTSARFSVLPDQSVGIVASKDGSALDLELVGRKILAAQPAIDAPLQVVTPERYTEWARSLGIKELVSTFTTHHACCAVRITNIHKAADYMNGTIVEPGEEFSLNDTVGPRTAERGFVSAPVFYGEFTEDFGGGVSQLATTTFNAAFWGGFEIIEYKPHSIYFDRYPMGREATVNYPRVDLRWRNNSDRGVLVQTSYTGEAITVTLFGDNEGRVVSEENEDGSCRVPESTDRITEARCVTILETTPIEDKEIPCNQATDKTDPDGECDSLAPGQREQVEDGYEGYVVVFWRIIEYPDRDPVREQFRWTYRMYPDTYVVGVGATPPPTTSPPPPTPTTQPTTTTAPPTTTTAPPTTTTVP